MSNLYHVQDDDRPMYVVAENYGAAVEKWKNVIADENHMDVGEVEEPQGVAFICDDMDLILE